MIEHNGAIDECYIFVPKNPSQFHLHKFATLHDSHAQITFPFSLLSAHHRLCAFPQSNRPITSSAAFKSSCNLVSILSKSASSPICSLPSNFALSPLIHSRIIFICADTNTDKHHSDPAPSDTSTSRASNFSRSSI